ncbi:domain-containing 5-like [Octopus vulgaris]|uniref:Domain-containing 5-like n=2 Tax=Octopus TaxID=6643 RepID=A0AA36F2P1_OCTVU|nr:TLC domain-containing protein 5-like [Octopus sinensis]XP_036358947.1 TLC domain-containing protein 5-like [Octopus sinensis]CAI9723456.1 domain-containing 5-like [Octopus vulgaris]
MLTQVVLTSSLWTSLYCFVCYFWRSKSYEWSCRSVSLLHALLITSLSYYCTFIQGPWPFTDAGGPNTPFQESIAIISVGYFIFDFFWCLYFQTDGQTMLCHHFVSIIALAICLITGSYGTEIVATIFGSEISNPLLQCRWFLKYSGNRDTAIADLVDAAFILTFTYVRIVVGSNLIYCYLSMPHIPIFMRVASITFYLISWAFWITILKFGYRKCLRKYQNFKNITKIDQVNSGILYPKDHSLLCSKSHQN